MGLSSDWKSAKARYDSAYKDAQKKLEPLNEKLKAAEYFEQAVKSGKYEDDRHMRKIKTYLKEFNPNTVHKLIDALRKEMVDHQVVEPRPTIGLEPTLRDIDKILQAGEKMVEKAVTDPEKWAQYRKIYDASAKKVMAANDKFKAFVTKRPYLPAIKALTKDHAGIIKDITLRSRAVYAYFDANVKRA